MREEMVMSKEHIITTIVYTLITAWNCGVMVYWLLRSLMVIMLMCPQLFCLGILMIVVHILTWVVEVGQLDGKQYILM